MALSNLALWNALRATNPSFASHTSEGTAELFTERGFETLKTTNLNAINEFFELSLRVALQKISVGNAKNLFEGIGLVEVYDTPNGGYTQRIAIGNIKPVTPGFKGLSDGESVDPFVVRKPESKERFFQQNFDYQNFITIQDFQVKTIFISEFGMSEYVSGIMRGLQNGYTIQESLNVKEALNSAINSTTFPLKNTQNVSVDSWTDGALTDAELQGYMLAIKMTLTSMMTTESTGAFNAGGFETVLDKDDYVIIQRAGIKDQLSVRTRLGAFNPDELDSGVEIYEVDNFGGIWYDGTVDGSADVRLYPHYDSFGAQDGWSSSEGGDLVEVEAGSLRAVDPNEDVIAIIAQKGLVFENRQNGYIINPIYNPRGLYTNYWASAPNNAINVDSYYNMVVIRKPTA